MASLDGLPPLPKSLSGLNLFQLNTSLQSSSSPVSLDHISSSLGRESSFNQNLSTSSENGNFGSTVGKYYSGSSASSNENNVGRVKISPSSRENTPTLNFKQFSDKSLLSSTGTNSVLNSSRNTPVGSTSRGSPVTMRGSTPPSRITTPILGMRNLPPPPPPPTRQKLITTSNGLDFSCSVPARPGRLFNLDAQLAILRKEMVRIVGYIIFFFFFL